MDPGRLGPAGLGPTFEDDRARQPEPQLVVDQQEGVHRREVPDVLKKHASPVGELALECLSDVHVEGLPGLQHVEQAREHERHHVLEPLQPLPGDLARVGFAGAQSANRAGQAPRVSEQARGDFEVVDRVEDADRQRHAPEPGPERHPLEQGLDHVADDAPLGLDDLPVDQRQLALLVQLEVALEVRVERLPGTARYGRASGEYLFQALLMYRHEAYLCKGSGGPVWCETKATGESRGWFVTSVPRASQNLGAVVCRE